MKKNRSIYLLLLSLIAIASHWQWFDFSSILTFSDWYYWPDRPTQQLWNSWGAWISFWTFGYGNIQVYFNVFDIVWSIFTSAGFSYDSAVKVTFFIPIAIFGFLSPFLLLCELTKDRLIAFAGALFYGTTTYFLIRQTGHLPIALVYSIFPLVFLLFLNALEKNKMYQWVIFSLFFWIIASYEIRITYIVSWVLSLWIIMFRILDIKYYIRNLLISGLIFILLSLFWLLPAIAGGLSRDISAIADRGIFGDSLFNIEQAFTLFDSSWTGGYPDMNFHPQPIPWYFLVIPLFILTTFVWRMFSPESKNQRSVVLFFATVSLTGVFLTKQAGPPLEPVYLWLYENFPGFNLFREASKFYILTAFGYAGLLGYGLTFVKNHWKGTVGKKIFYGVSGIVIVLSLWNLKPLVTGEIGTLFVPRQMPQDYSLLEKYILDQTGGSGFFRTFWSPTYSRWGIYDNQHPKISNVEVIQSDWNKLSLGEKLLKKLPNEEKITNILNQPFSDRLLDIASVKYVIVPLQDIANDDDFFKYYGDRKFFVRYLDTVPYLKRVDMGMREVVLYENENYRPHIYTTHDVESIYREVPFTSVDFEFKNPTEYHVSMKRVSDPVYVNFSEKYHPGWKVRVGDFRWFDVLWSDDYFVSDKQHLKNDAGLNSFLIDPREMCGQSSSKCHRNNDGSYDIDLTIYFKPQSYFYLGLIISGVTLIGCLGYLMYDAWKVDRKPMDSTA